MAERKISDIVLDMENRLQRIAGIVQNTDNNVKLILDKLNHLANVQLPPAPVDGSPIVARPIVRPAQQQQMARTQSQGPVARGEDPDAPQTANYAPQHKQKMFIAKPVTEQSYELDDHGQPELMEEVVRKGKRRDLRKPADASQTKKVAVSQQIAFPDGKAVFLANVEIFDDANNLVKQTRTNSQGRWLAPLEPGQYTVHILKRLSADSKKQPVELRFQVQIPESSGPVELPGPDLPVE